MSHTRQKPEHLIIRKFIEHLVESKKIRMPALRDVFIEVYCDMIPPTGDAPVFDPVHRHDTVAESERKDETNGKKLSRAIFGGSYFPLAYKEPLLVALDQIAPGQGLKLRKLLLRNTGLLHMPIDVDGDATIVYAELLQEFAEANVAMVSDMGDDGILNNENTRNELLDSLEKHLQALRHIDKNRN